ncbi:RHS repeat-associated core domain-containing protein [Yeosuana marina]|uniref:RHS repeat-associated core domain-containing protein n=1 Tax=Yeosuana marina TaxID=1565536 RepID=UPI0030C855D9
MRVLLSISFLGFCVSSAAQNSSRTLGNKSYEVSNHLGNVMAVVSDRNLATPETTNTTIAFKETDIKVYNDYYPYGMVLENRNEAINYRFGFQGQEKDDEVKGKSNSYNTFYRQYDSRIARWTSIDPITHHQMSQYQSYDNNPLYWTDSRGSSTDSTTVKKNSANHSNVPQRNKFNTGETQAKRVTNAEATSHYIGSGGLTQPSDQITTQARAIAVMNPVINEDEDVDVAWESQKQVAFAILTNTYGESTPSFSVSGGVGIVSAGIDSNGEASVDSDVIPIADFFIPYSYINQKIDYKNNGLEDKTVAYNEISTKSIGVSGKIGIGGSVQSAEVTFKVKNALGVIISTTYEFSKGSIGIGLSAGKETGVNLDYNMSWELKKVVTKIGDKVISTQLE